MKTHAPFVTAGLAGVAAYASGARHEYLLVLVVICCIGGALQVYRLAGGSK